MTKHINVGRQTKTYINNLCMNTGCRLEDSTRVIADKDGWRKRKIVIVKAIHAVGPPCGCFMIKSCITQTFLSLYNNLVKHCVVCLIGRSSFVTYWLLNQMWNGWRKVKGFHSYLYSFKSCWIATVFILSICLCLMF